MRASSILLAMLLASLAALAAALLSQHVFGMRPCPWCIFQRLVLVAIALACALGLVWRSAVGRSVGATLAMVLALGGLAAALWQHFVASASDACNLTFADRVIEALQLAYLAPALFEPRASCADAAVRLLGLPYEAWSGALFALLVLAGWRVLQARRA
jgi:disulfide bond formation protein DsbB